MESFLPICAGLLIFSLIMLCIRLIESVDYEHLK